MRKLFIALSLLVAVAVQAQEDNVLFKHVSAGLNLGTNGIGFEVGTTLTPILEMRAGMDFMPNININKTLKYDRPKELNNVPGELLNERYVNIPEYGAKVDIRIKTFLTQGKVLFDIFTSKESSFHFTVGAYFGNSVIGKGRCADKTIAAVELYNQDIKNGLIKAEPQYPDGIKIDMEGYSLGHDQGRAELQAKVSSFRPYVGIGFGRTVPRKHRLGCKFDFGVQFWGAPKLYDKYNNDHQIKKSEPGLSKDFQDGLDIAEKVSVYPTIKFSLFGRIL